MIWNKSICAAALCLASSFAAAELSIVAPVDRSTVPTLRDGQKSYLMLGRKARFARLDDPAARNKMLAVGSSQLPVKLEWKGAKDEEIELTIVPLPDGREEFFTLKGVTSAYITNLELDREYRWMVRDSSGYATAMFKTEAHPPRSLKADGLSNFRDLGGWSTLGGRRVRENLIFRSAGLRNSSKRVGGTLFAPKYEVGSRRITDAGLATLHNEFAIKTDIELRSVAECAGVDSTLIDGAKWVHIPFAAYDFIDNMARGKEPFAKIFHLFADRENYPILMHCSGGRDRTGTVAFILLGLLGVSEEDLLRDWEYSAFSDAGSKFNSGRIGRLLGYINGFPGENFNAKVEAYVLGCGVSQAEIDTFRKIMLK